MGSVSTVKRLPPEIREEIHRLLDSGQTLDAIVGHLRGLGVNEVSRSALGRYKKNFDVLVERMRRSREVSEAVVRNFGQEAESKTARLNMEMMQSVIFDLMLKCQAEDGEDGGDVTLDAKQAQALSAAMANLARARRLDQDAIVRAREEAAKEAEARMAEAVDKVGAEASGPLTVAQMKERMLAVYRGEA